ncbi:hypothetical protein JG688_00016584, partial [Phytophthora aleatoria]
VSAQETLECRSDDSTWISPSIVERLKAKKYPSISPAERQVMDAAFDSAVHRSGTSSLLGMPEHILFPTELNCIHYLHLTQKICLKHNKKRFISFFSLDFIKKQINTLDM